MVLRSGVSGTIFISLDFLRKILGVIIWLSLFFLVGCLVSSFIRGNLGSLYDVPDYNWDILWLVFDPPSSFEGINL